ncbi:MAG TPA: Crp/Fnr family transcriptional regulator [Cyclobacteriaceae bacterium]|nr:Crp/Fnr family transcriptional regulator [Cyclobacteriaceae bacterium]
MTTSNEAYQRVREYFNSIVPFTKEEFDKVTSLAKPFRLKKGELIYEQGNVPEYGGFILQGCMRNFFTSDDGQEDTTVGFKFENTCFADLRSIFYEEPAITSLQALEDTLIVRFEKADYLHLFDTCNSFAKLMLLVMEHRYNELINETIKRKNEQAEERYLKMLEDFPRILQRVPQRYVASYLGIKPQSLSRIRKNIMMQERTTSIHRAA